VKYVQHNPLPTVAGSQSAEIDSTIQTVFDWEYGLHEEKLLSLYEKGKNGAWNANDLDWTTDVDIDRMMANRTSSGFGRVMNDVLQAPRTLENTDVVRLLLHMNAFVLSQFLHGEQGALLATAKLVQAVPTTEAKFYAASQVSDEARHVEVYHRYLTEKLGVSYPVHSSLETLLSDILGDSRWDITFLGTQILVEGLALAAFGMLKLQMSDEPLILDITSRVMADEARHVAFGVQMLQEQYQGGMESHELREREDFVIESVGLLHERLLMDQVFDRMGWDVDVWTKWSETTAFMTGFRQMTFSKIVPNLKRLGLLTPRVRGALETLDLLKFEHMKDSVEEPEAAPPAELVQLLMHFMAKEAGSAEATA